MKHLMLFENFEVNDKIQAIIDTINTNEGFEVIHTKALNDTLFLKVKIPRVERPDYGFMSEVNRIPYVKGVYGKGFFMGKKVDNCAYIQFNLLLKHGVTDVSLSAGFGRIIAFLQKYNIKSIDEFNDIIARSANDLNKYIKICDKPKAEKVKLYSLKSSAVKFLVKNGGISDVKFHKGEYEDLVLFITNTDNISFHMQARKFFDKFGVYPESLDKIEDDVYKSKQYTEEDIQDQDRMFDAMKILALINQNILQIYNYFNEKIFDLNNYFYNPSHIGGNDMLPEDGYEPYL
jgi:hypothetical protein